DDDRADDEQPPPRRMVDDHARKRQAKPGCGAEHGRDRAEGKPTALARENVTDNGEAKREYRSTCALDNAELRSDVLLRLSPTTEDFATGLLGGRERPLRRERPSRVDRGLGARLRACWCR